MPRSSDGDLGDIRIDYQPSQYFLNFHLLTKEKTNKSQHQTDYILRRQSSKKHKEKPSFASDFYLCVFKKYISLVIH